MSVDTDIAELFKRVEALEANPADTGIKFDTIPNPITGASSQFGNWLDILTIGGAISPNDETIRIIDSSGDFGGGILLAMQNIGTPNNAALYLQPVDNGIDPIYGLARLYGYRTALESDDVIQFLDSGSHRALLQQDQDGTLHIYGDIVAGNSEKFRVDADGTIHGLASVGGITWDLP